jgi:hypothetical protein
MQPKWKQHEKKQAKDFGGRVSKGSGNFWAQPGDIKTDDFLIEAKQTDKKSYSIKYETWDKIYEEALFSQRIPLLSLLLRDIELVIVQKGDFLKLINCDKTL